jgi:H+/Cl- antiporter ClcA
MGKDEPDRIVEEDLKGDVKPKASLDYDRIIKSIESNRIGIRTITPALLNTCGLLLTISLGAIYFLLKDSRELLSYLPSYARIILFLIPIALSFAILFGVLSIVLRTEPASVDDKTIILASITKNYEDERFWFKLSCVVLGAAILVHYNESIKSYKISSI